MLRRKKGIKFFLHDFFLQGKFIFLFFFFLSFSLSMDTKTQRFAQINEGTLAGWKKTLI